MNGILVLSRFKDQELSDGVIKLPEWKAWWFPVTRGDVMSSEIVRRGKEGIY